MLSALRQYARDEVLPRSKSIALAEHFALAVIMAVLAGAKGELLFATGMKPIEVVPVVLTYAAIALGFCVAGMTVALTVPDREFARTLARRNLEPRGPTRNAYADLLFVFSWTAFTHWLTILASVGALVVARSHTVILPHGASIWNRATVGVVVFLSCYGLFQFLVTLITLSQVGRVYIGFLRGDQVPNSPPR